ncbi:hypothetical protein K505DRAFT_347916 [Melanomma pulvis-pyrius CBS 109.77]|uniref:Uncharacterized protein n=1 Tax=Melanomma pulvis-pyrius CBS 109.77 TaxID=1314802 RepID=A0A6A6XIY6_9PLEO|nr:hypothetical protein K505DRAFT_347916 [Melanomma pulvis-pyrius CBS 109.77]
MPSVKLSEKLFTFLKPKPVFNQPVNTERQHHISRVLYLLLLSLFVGISVAVIGIKAMTLSFIEDNSDTGFVFDTGDSEPMILAALPRQLYTVPAKLTLVAAVLSIFVALGHMLYLIIDWKSGQRTQSYAFRRNAMFVHFTHSILVLFSLVSIYITHKMASHFREGYIMRQANNNNNNNNNNNSDGNPDGGVRYNIGTFDLETWSCELKSVKGAMMVWEDYSKQCDIEVAGRVIMIPFVIVAFALAALSISLMIGSRRDPDGERMKTEDVGLEMGKFNAI